MAYSVRFSEELESTATARGPMTGAILADRYRVGRLIGEGGMGYVYEAVHLAIEKRFAIKVLAEEMCSHPSHVERFLREARTTSKLDHENIVDISDCGPTGTGSVFFVMEYLDGEDLGTLIDREAPLSWERARHLILQLCDALTSAHAQGVVHRDIKPQNCFRTTRRRDPDFLKVLDFGIAKLLGEEHASGRKLTRTGQIFGTPEYMSPEQIRGMPADPRMDVYAAGVIMYELLVGKTPFVGEAPLEVLAKHIHDPVPAIAGARVEAGLAAQIDAVIARALAKDASLRFQSSEELAAAIIAVDTAGATQRTPSPTTADKAPSTLAGMRRPEHRTSSLALILVFAAAILLSGVAFVAAPRWFGSAERAADNAVYSDAGAGTGVPVPVSVPAGGSAIPSAIPSVREPSATDTEPASEASLSLVDPSRPTHPVRDVRPVDAPQAAAAAPKDVDKPITRPPSPPSPTASLKPAPTNAEVEKRVRAALAGSCVRVDLMKWDASETVRVNFTLQRKSAKVTKVSAKHSRSEDKIAACVASKVGALRFPEGRETGSYSVTIAGGS
jgi:serine/threonine-protein kinase